MTVFTTILLVAILAFIGGFIVGRNTKKAK